MAQGPSILAVGRPLHRVPRTAAKVRNPGPTWRRRQRTQREPRAARQRTFWMLEHTCVGLYPFLPASFSCSFPYTSRCTHRGQRGSCGGRGHAGGLLGSHPPSRSAVHSHGGEQLSRTMNPSGRQQTVDLSDQTNRRHRRHGTSPARPRQSLTRRIHRTATPEAVSATRTLRLLNDPVGAKAAPRAGLAGMNQSRPGGRLERAWPIPARPSLLAP